MLAITHTVPDCFHRCVTTHIDKTKPDLSRAREQWESYCQALRDAGCGVHVLEANSHLPDAPFVEDTGVMVGEVFIAARMSAPTRSSETQAVIAHLAETHQITRLSPPAYLDGGDVLMLHENFFVGLSGRTNRAGFLQFKEIVNSLGFQAAPVQVTGCLHLKTAVTAVDQETVILNPGWVDPRLFSDYRVLKVPSSEPFSANLLRVKSHLFVAAGHPRRDDLLNQNGFDFQTIDISELEKAEAGLTCLSILASYP